MLTLFILQDLHSRNLHNEKFSYDNDMASAPPFCGGQEITESAELASGVHKTAGTADSSGFSANNDPNKTKTMPGVELKDNPENKNPDQFPRFLLFF